MCQLSKADAEAFYAVHAGRPFFSSLCSFMTSGPIVALELMAASSIRKWRDLLGERGSIGTLPLDCITKDPELWFCQPRYECKCIMLDKLPP
jgi:hypothetical protein